MAALQFVLRSAESEQPRMVGRVRSQTRMAPAGTVPPPHQLRRSSSSHSTAAAADTAAEGGAGLEGVGGRAASLHRTSSAHSTAEAAAAAAEAAAALEAEEAVVVVAEKIVECDANKCVEAGRKAAAAPYHWLQEAVSSSDPVLIEVVLEAIASTRVKRTEVNVLENHLKDLLAALREEAPPPPQLHEDIEDVLRALGVSGHLMRQCWSVLEQADARHWSSKMERTTDENKNIRAKRWDSVRILFVEVYSDHSKRVDIACATVDGYSETRTVQDIREMLKTCQAYDLQVAVLNSKINFSSTSVNCAKQRGCSSNMTVWPLQDVSPKIGPVVMKLAHLAEHCDHNELIDSVMQSTDVNLIDETLSRFIEDGLADVECLCKWRRSMHFCPLRSTHVIPPESI